MAGGLNANAVASGTCVASARFRLRRIPRASSAAPSRLLHGLSWMNMTAAAGPGLDEEASHRSTLGRRLERHRLDRHAVPDFLDPFGHHLLARRYPVLDHPHRADARSD